MKTFEAQHLELKNYQKGIVKIILGMFLLTAVLLVPSSKGNAQSVNSVNKITGAYLSLKNALVTDNGQLAEEKAKLLFAALSDKPEQGLTSAQQKTLNIYLDKLKFDSRHMSETAAIDHQREHFASLSKNMYMLLKGLDANASPVYVQYCPMKKSYWLSETEKIQNPYYGKRMLTCGETKDTLKATGK